MIRPAAGSPASRTSFLLDRGAWTTFFVVSMAFGVTVLEAGPTWSLALQAGAVALVYVLVAVGLEGRLLRPGPLLPRISYFLLQLLVLGILSAILVRHQVFGVAWLFFMPLVSQSRMILPALGTATVCLGSLGILSLHIAALGGWGEAGRGMFALTTAIVFVLIFTDIAMREKSARDESQRLSEELEHANRRLGEYAVQAEELSAARERARMAREIHDSVGHSLTAVHMQIEAARTMLDRRPEKTRDALGKAQRCIQDGLAEIRRSVSTLRADPLEGRNLHGALTDLAELSMSSGLPVRLRILGRQRPLSPAVTLALFRCAQEGLTNAKKHARARRVDLELDYGEVEAGEHLVRLRVSDDGVGSRATHDGGFGLLGLRERLRQLEGQLDVVSENGKGLSLRAEIPTPRPAAEARA